MGCLHSERQMPPNRALEVVHCMFRDFHFSVQKLCDIVMEGVKNKSRHAHIPTHEGKMECRARADSGGVVSGDSLTRGASWLLPLPSHPP